MLLCEARLVGQAGLHRSGVTERAAGTVRWLRGGCSRWWAPSTPLKVVRQDNTITEQTQTFFLRCLCPEGMFSTTAFFSFLCPG